MHTDDILRLTQWLSPAFPVSSYAYSHGLEAEVVAGRLRDGRDVQEWISAVLVVGAGRSDAILMRAARHGLAELSALGDLALALAGSRERVVETTAQGRALAETLAALGHGDGVARPYPVVLGLAARGLALDDVTVAALYLQSFAAGLVSAAVRFVPLGQAEGQRVLSELQATIAEVASDAALAGLEDIGAAVFGADLAAMIHETLEVRIFRT